MPYWGTEPEEKYITLHPMISVISQKLLLGLTCN